jgi:hypothetical protein
MSAKYIDQPDGSIRVEYDTPEEDPSHREDGQAIEHEPVVTELDEGESFTIQAFTDSHRKRWMRAIPHHVEELIRRAREKLKPGVIFEIRAKIPTDYGTRLGVAWYTNHDLQSGEPDPELLPYPGKMNELGGYCYMGRLRA